MPDVALMAAADANSLTTPDEVAAQARRLLADPRADETFGDFVTQWLELGPLRDTIKDATAYPAFKPELRDTMRAETVAFARDVLRSASPTLAPRSIDNPSAWAPTIARRSSFTWMRFATSNASFREGRSPPLACRRRSVRPISNRWRPFLRSSTPKWI